MFDPSCGQLVELGATEDVTVVYSFRFYCQTVLSDSVLGMVCELGCHQPMVESLNPKGLLGKEPRFACCANLKAGSGSWRRER